MSLRLYSPDDLDLANQSEPILTLYSEPELDEFDESDDSGTVLSWRIGHRNRLTGSYMEIVQRSRLLHAHRRCQKCGRPTVRPVVREDSQVGTNRLPVPGTGTVVGFHCDYCRKEWSA